MPLQSDKRVTLVIMDPTGKPSPLSGSGKVDSTPADKLKRGIPLLLWPTYSMTSLEEPTGGAGHRPYSHTQSPVVVYAVYDKSAARILQPLVNGVNLGTATITESVRANSAGDVISKILTLTGTYLDAIEWWYDERLTARYAPGGIIKLSFKYVEIGLSETIFDPLTLTSTGNQAWDYKVQEAASS
jgi:hypothetical protein